VLLTGQPPFADAQPLTIMLQHLNTVPGSPRTIRPDIPSELDHLTLELLAKDPAHRPADAGHIITALRPLCYTPTVKVELFPRTDQESGEQPDRPTAESICATASGATLISPLEVSGNNSKVLEIELTSGRYLLSWSAEGPGIYLSVRDESEEGGKGTSLLGAVPAHTSSGEKIIRLVESGRHLLSVAGDRLAWKLTFKPI
jgi:serine/threonine protein kinase